MPKNSTDKNHNIGYLALKRRCGGYEKDKELGHHYAWLRGYRIVAYDLHKVGFGIPDWLHFVSWMPIFFEVKQERELKSQPVGKTGKRGGQFGNANRKKYNDKEYYYRQLEDMEKTFSFHHPGLTAIVHDYNEVYEWLNLVIDFVEYVEGKAEGSRPLLDLFFRNAVQRQDTVFYSNQKGGETNDSGNGDQPASG